MEFITLLSIWSVFENYGIIITIVILFILIAYMLVNNSSKRIREQEDKIDSLYTRIDELMGKFTPDGSNKELAGKFIEYAENTNKIQIQIYHLLQKFKADRVSIYEFHNGGKSLSGVDFKKCTNIFEAVSLETKPIIKEMQNLILSMNPLWNMLLSDGNDIIIPSTEDIEDSFLKNYLTSQSIKSYYSILLSDYSNSPIGLMSLENYHNSNPLTEEQFREFKDMAIKISIIINLK